MYEGGGLGTRVWNTGVKVCTRQGVRVCAESGVRGVWDGLCMEVSVAAGYAGYGCVGNGLCAGQAVSRCVCACVCMCVSVCWGVMVGKRTGGSSPVATPAGTPAGGGAAEGCRASLLPGTRSGSLSPGRGSAFAGRLRRGRVPASVCMTLFLLRTTGEI